MIMAAPTPKKDKIKTCFQLVKIILKTDLNFFCQVKISIKNRDDIKIRKKIVASGEKATKESFAKRPMAPPKMERYSIKNIFVSAGFLKMPNIQNKKAPA